MKTSDWCSALLKYKKRSDFNINNWQLNKTPTYLCETVWIFRVVCDICRMILSGKSRRWRNESNQSLHVSKHLHKKRFAKWMMISLYVYLTPVTVTSAWGYTTADQDGWQVFAWLTQGEDAQCTSCLEVKSCVVLFFCLFFSSQHMLALT